MRTVRPKFAAAPKAKIPTRAAAATGTETGRPAGAVPENRSMMRPIVKGIESDIVEDTHSSPIAIAIVFLSGFASIASRLTSLSCIFSPPNPTFFTTAATPSLEAPFSKSDFLSPAEIRLAAVCCAVGGEVAGEAAVVAHRLLITVFAILLCLPFEREAVGRTFRGEIGDIVEASFAIDLELESPFTYDLEVEAKALRSLPRALKLLELDAVDIMFHLACNPFV